ncbi:MAG: fructose-specific PTS transporter subunit EIIC [Treponema sp.]|nr:fructose-specific PTS transporter subunit EIIC [Treponema sp.]
MKDTFVAVVTACPTGIAHTFMAAESLERAAESLGCRIRIETQGALGAGTPLSAEEIAASNFVLIAADREVDRSRFTGKRVYETDTKTAIIDGIELIRLACKKAEVQTGLGFHSGKTSDPNEYSGAVSASGKGKGKRDSQAAPPGTGAVSTASAAVMAFFRDMGRNLAGSGYPGKHLMNGVSFMLPFVMAGGLCSALSTALGEAEGRQVNLLLHIVRDGGFALLTPTLAAAIAWSIADRPGLAPGMIGGLLCNILNTGFWGGIVTGFTAGYSVFLLNCLIRLPKNLAGLKPMIVLPFAGTFAAGSLIYFVIGMPLARLNRFLIEWLNGLQGLSPIALGIFLGGMMALDLGGFINKIAYTFAIGMLGAGIAQPMAAVMAAGMTPPLSAALAVLLFRSRFTDEERKAGGTAFVLGAAFNSEGALPFASADPLRAVPSFIAGSGLAGALSMFFGIRLMVPHGGLFSLAIPGGISDIPLYLAAIASGTLLSALLFGLFKRMPSYSARL